MVVVDVVVVVVCCFGLVNALCKCCDGLERGNWIFPALQWACISHNSLDIKAKIMGLSALESYCRALQG